MTDERDYGSLEAVPVAELRREMTERKRAEGHLLRRTSQLEILLRLSRQLNEVLEIPVVMRSLVSAAMELTGATSGAAGLLEDGIMVFTEYNEHGKLLPVQYRFPPGYGVPGWVAQTKEPYVTNDPAHDPHVILEIQRALDFQNLVDVPILSRTGQLLGCFEIHNKSEGAEPFDERDVEILRSLAASASVALENAAILDERREAQEALREAESKYRSLVEESLVGVYTIQDGLLVYVNPRLAEIFGYAVDEITGMPAIETVAPEDRELVSENIRRRLEAEVKSIHYTFRGLRKDGAIVDVEVYGSRMFYQGRPAVTGSMLDITDRKRAEEALRESEEKFRMLAQNANVVVGIVQGTKFVYVNPYLEKISGYSQDELLSMDIQDLIAADFQQLVLERARKRQLGEPVPTHYEFKMVTKSGEERWMDMSLAGIEYKGRPAIVGVAYDVTTRKNAELTLARLAAIVKATSDYAAIGTIDGRLLYMNKAGREMVGLGLDEDITDKRVLDFHPPWSTRTILEEGIPTVLKTGIWRGETALIGRDGRIIPTSQVIMSFRQPDTDETYIATIMRDVTPQKRAQEDLRRYAERFKAIFDSAPAAMVIYDDHGIVQQANQAFADMTGFSGDAIVGRPIFDTFVKPEDRERASQAIDQVMAGNVLRGVEWEVVRPDGTLLWAVTNLTPLVADDGRVEAILALGIDITDRKLAEQRRNELDAHKRDFYRRTIEAATEGKLAITERSEICRIAGEPMASWDLTTGEQLGTIRSEITGIAREFGMEEDRVFDFVLSVGEATTNAIKHANGGTISLHRLDDSLMLVVADRGPGIEALALPELALKKGYTTAVSLGMGYKEMISIADKVYLATGPDGTTVALEMARQRKKECPLAAVLPDTW